MIAWRRWRPGALDAYVFQHAALRLIATVVVVVAILTLENAPRLIADLQRTDAPATLLWRLSLYLVPEQLSVALPLATLLAIALTVRSLAGRGEWQMLAAAGMSPARALLAPSALAALAALVLASNALLMRPAGERQVDALYAELVGGAHGVPVPLREPVRLDDDSTLVAEAPGDAPGELRGVVIQQGSSTLSAERAHIAGDGKGGVALLLRGGVAVEAGAGGAMRRIAFDEMTVHGRPPILTLVPGNLRHRLDRLGGEALWRLARTSDDAPMQQGALAALLARAEAALFCLLLPWLAAAVGVPPRRQAGGPALLVGVVLIVLHLKAAAAVEDALAAHAVAATLAHAAAWIAATAGITRSIRARGDGAIDEMMAASVRRVKRWFLQSWRVPALGRSGEGWPGAWPSPAPFALPRRLAAARQAR